MNRDNVTQDHTSESTVAGDGQVIDHDIPSEAHDVEQISPVQEHEEEVTENGRSVRRRGIFLLPNLLTTGAIFSGFLRNIGGNEWPF